MQNSLSKFYNFSFQSFMFAFYHFNPLSFNSSQFNPPLTFHLLLLLNCSKQCRFGLNLIFNIYLFLNLKNPKIRGRGETDRRTKSGCCCLRLLSYISTRIFLHHQSKPTNEHRLFKLNHQILTHKKIK